MDGLTHVQCQLLCSNPQSRCFNQNVIDNGILFFYLSTFFVWRHVVSMNCTRFYTLTDCEINKNKYL